LAGGPAAHLTPPTSNTPKTDTPPSVSKCCVPRSHTTVANTPVGSVGASSVSCSMLSGLAAALCAGGSRTRWPPATTLLQHSTSHGMQPGPSIVQTCTLSGQRRRISSSGGVGSSVDGVGAGGGGGVAVNERQDRQPKVRFSPVRNLDGVPPPLPFNGKCNAQYMVDGGRCAVCRVWCAVRVRCAVCGVRCAVCGVRCVLYSV
jgi:hypothetical protein